MEFQYSSDAADEMCESGGGSLGPNEEVDVILASEGTLSSDWAEGGDVVRAFFEGGILQKLSSKFDTIRI